MMRRLHRQTTLSLNKETAFPAQTGDVSASR
jgi:hypothetical protein